MNSPCNIEQGINVSAKSPVIQHNNYHLRAITCSSQDEYAYVEHVQLNINHHVYLGTSITEV